MTYELLAIFPNAFTGEEVATGHKKLLELIITAGGSVVKDEIAGRKRFSYPIKTDRSGIYTYIQFGLEPSSTVALEQTVRLNIKTRRFSITKYVESPQHIMPSVPRTPNKPEPLAAEPQELKPEDIKKLDSKIEELLNEEIK